MNVPGIDVNVPGVGVSVPGAGVNVPPPQLPNLPDPDAGLPDVGGLAPAAQALLAAPLALPQLAVKPAVTIAGLPNVAVTGSALVDSVLSSATALTTQVADFGLEASSVGGGAQGGAADGVATASVGSVNSGVSAFTFSGISHTSHDGFAVTSAGGGGRTPGFESLQYGVTLGVRADASKALGFKKNTLALGLFGNANRADIDIDASGGRAGADASLESWGFGGYALATNGVLYGLFTAMGSWGEASVDDFAAGATSDFDTNGIATQAVGGVLIPVVPGLTLDARGGLTWIEGGAGSYVDSIGARFGDANVEEFSGAASLKLFASIPMGGGAVRPFAQGGVTHRFDYDTEVVVDGTELSFNDADTLVTGRLGVDFDVAGSWQGYVAVRGDKSEDVESIGGQVGLTLILN